MKCPLRIDHTEISGDHNEDVNYYYQECIRQNCTAWEANAKYNPETKTYEGDCRAFMLDRKITGGINAHPY